VTFLHRKAKSFSKTLSRIKTTECDSCKVEHHSLSLSEGQTRRKARTQSHRSTDVSRDSGVAVMKLIGVVLTPISKAIHTVLLARRHLHTGRLLRPACLESDVLSVAVARQRVKVRRAHLSAKSDG
jgi:hypothetical protein